MLNKRIFVLMFLLVFLPLVGCIPSPAPPIAENQAPVIVSTPITTAKIGVEYTYNVKAIDPDEDSLTYSLIVKPGVMTINSTAGVISWKPVCGQAGDNPVIVEVSDGALNDTQSFIIKVGTSPAPPAPPVNHAPIITSIPGLIAIVGVEYTYTIKATDPDGDSITYSLIYPPTGMTFDGIATISWIPAEVQIGYFDVTVKASDGILSDTQSFTITVSELPAVNHPPIITSTPGNTAIVDELYTYEIEATDPDGDVLTYSLITKPEGMTITSNIVSWTPTEGQIGYHDFVIKVSDGQLFTTRGSYIMVRELWLELTGITVEPKTMDLIVGDTDTIDSVTAAYEFRGYEDPVDLRDCTFLTSDSEVATVEKVGNVVTVTAVGVGTVDILVSYGGKFDTIGVTVIVPKIDGILSPGEWDGTTEIPVADGMGTVWVLATTDYLYVAFDVVDSTDARLGENIKGNDQTGLNINPTEGGPYGKPYDIVFQTGADHTAFTTPDPDTLGSSGLTDNWYTEWVIDGTQFDLPSGLKTKTFYSGNNRISEWKVPLTSTVPSTGDVLKVGGSVATDLFGNLSYTFPDDLDWGDASTYVKIIVY